VTPAQGRKWKRELLRQIARDQKRAARERLVSLRTQIREAKALRRTALVSARQRCKAERIAARARARAMRERVLAELREAMARERAAARSTCSADLSAARGLADKVSRARAELDAERRYQRELKRIEGANRASRLEEKRASARERRQESDDEVRGNIPPEMVSLFERVKGKIRGSDRMTRTEAFLEYAHNNPGEVLEALEDRTAALIAELEERERAERRTMRRRPTRAELEAAVVAAGGPQLAEAPF